MAATQSNIRGQLFLGAKFTRFIINVYMSIKMHIKHVGSINIVLIFEKKEVETEELSLKIFVINPLGSFFESSISGLTSNTSWTCAGICGSMVKEGCQCMECGPMMHAW
jgi:hypothetical protein